MDVEHLLAASAGSSAGESLHEIVLVDVHTESHGDRRLHRSEHAVEALRLGRVSGEAVEDIAALAVILCEPFLDEPDHDGIGDELTSIHVRSRFFSKGGTLGHGFPEDIAGGDLGNRVLVDEFLGLCSFSGSRSS